MDTWCKYRWSELSHSEICRNCVPSTVQECTIQIIQHPLNRRDNHGDPVSRGNIVDHTRGDSIIFVIKIPNLLRTTFSAFVTTSQNAPDSGRNVSPLPKQESNIERSDVRSFLNWESIFHCAVLATGPSNNFALQPQNGGHNSSNAFQCGRLRMSQHKGRIRHNRDSGERVEFCCWNSFEVILYWKEDVGRLPRDGNKKKRNRTSYVFIDLNGCNQNSPII